MTEAIKHASDDLLAYRREFPILEERTYLASHSLGAMPWASALAIREYYEHWAKDGILAWDGEWWRSIEVFCDHLGAILNAPATSIVPMLNVTRAFAAIASCYEYSPKRNKVVLTALEFTTSYPFWKGQERLGAEVVVVPSDDGMTVSTERILDAIDERTLFVPTSHVYFRSAAVQDLAAIVKKAHEVGAICIGDGYQTVGTIPVDVTELGVDFYVGGCHKWLCGGAGAGWLYVNPDLLPSLNPRLTGWFGLANPFSYEPTTNVPEHHPTALRFLAGTPNVPGMFAAREGLRLIRQIGVPAIRERSQKLTSRIIDEALSRGLTIRTPHDPELRSGMVCLDFEEAERVCETLIERNVVVDYRPDCGIRVSPHFYNSVADLDRFFVELDLAR
jgi:kynureninase